MPKILPLTELTAITTLDGRYRKDVVELAPHVSEYNIIRTRVEIEAKYLISLSKVGVVRPLSSLEREKLSSFGANISLEDAIKIKKIEDVTEHDVKAMELAFKEMLSGTSLEDLTEKVHFGLTSEDINNLTYRLILKRSCEDVMLPNLNLMVDKLTDWAGKYKSVSMLARTHGQAAVPTTLGHEFAVFAKRLNKEVRILDERVLEGKLNGAVGNFNSLKDSFPKVDWISFAKKFVESFGFKPNLTTTQIAPYEDLIKDFQTFIRINNILVDFDQDVWRYISDHWFAQEVKRTATSSSTMAQKVNPIRFENSEGNLGKANAIFEFFTEKLPKSRLQRDLSDSTVIREMGAPLGWSLVAYKNTLKGLERIWPNLDLIAQVLNEDWSILSEAAQTRMRDYGIEDPYTIMKDLTRSGEKMDKIKWLEIVGNLPITNAQKTDLKELTPQKYIGFAVELAEEAIEEIKSSRNN
ncbi:MAG: purB [Candidatus Levybacteria bacterium]|nr:purB [Candidatus Levybacteria bacterium]